MGKRHAKQIKNAFLIFASIRIYLLQSHLHLHSLFQILKKIIYRFLSLFHYLYQFQIQKKILPHFLSLHRFLFQCQIQKRTHSLSHTLNQNQNQSLYHIQLTNASFARNLRFAALKENVLTFAPWCYVLQDLFAKMEHVNLKNSKDNVKLMKIVMFNRDVTVESVGQAVP